MATADIETSVEFPRPLVIYHANCADGFSAAWVARRYWQTSSIARVPPQYLPARYGDAAPDVTGREVYLLDFSYPREVVSRMVRQARRVTLIDHHQTAIEQLADLPGLIAYTDINRCGATLAWDYWFPNQQRPLLLGHIEDRDLWRFQLDHTREIQAAVFSHPYSFEAWDRLMASSEHDLVHMTAQGKAILRRHQKDLAELLATTRRTLTIDGLVVPVANLPHTFASDAGEQLCQGFAFAAVYWDTEHHRQFSLRSQAPHGADVARIAEGYGGGGHRHAAGFRVPRYHPLARE